VNPGFIGTGSGGAASPFSPPESAIRPEFVRKVKKARTDIKKGKGKTYDSFDDFFKEIEA